MHSVSPASEAPSRPPTKHSVLPLARLQLCAGGRPREEHTAGRQVLLGTARVFIHDLEAGRVEAESRRGKTEF